MPLSISRRAERIVQAEIRAMSIECEKMGGINLAQGVCDTAVPPSVLRGAETAMHNGVNSYTRYDGLVELRSAIAAKIAVENGIIVDPDTEVVVSSGSTGSFYCACLALLNPGDEVILFEPYYGYHVNTLLAVEAVPAFVTMRAPQWTFTPHAHALANESWNFVLPRLSANCTEFRYHGQFRPARNLASMLRAASAGVLP